MTQGNIRPVGTLDELRKIVPTEQIELKSEVGQTAAGSWAVEPATLDELVDVMKWASTRNGAVYTRHPRSRDAEICGERPRIYLRGRRMRRVRDLDIVSGTVTVQSGITMKELNQALAEHGYTTRFPTRPWHTEPLGAVLSASLDAHWGPPYGAMEGNVVGLGVVFPDGTHTRTLGVPRRAAGPDFTQFFLGSRGRYGIIYEATLRITPGVSRVILTYGAKDLVDALAAVRGVLEEGVSLRAVEILTPAADRVWGRKRAGLTEDLPVLLLLEPWHVDGEGSAGQLTELLDRKLSRLEPPVGWAVHEGLLPPPRAWRAPVVGCTWRSLEDLATELDGMVPDGLWIVRMSRQGGWLSLSEGSEGPAAEPVRRVIGEHLHDPSGPLGAFHAQLKEKLDPLSILNPD